MSAKRVCIVGAGGSGLPCIHNAKLYGFDVTCFEASDGVGGLWRYKPYTTEDSSVMYGTVINTSKEMTAYSDYIPPEDAPAYMHNSTLYKYMCDYAKEKGLMEHIKLQHRVVSIVRASDYKTTGRWVVTYLDSERKTHIDVFDGVLLATGHHANNNWPEAMPGQDKFQGKLMHGHDYKTPSLYEGKTVAVVGAGNSGVDVASELARVTKQVYLVTRSGAWVFSKMASYGSPIDMVLNNRLLNNFIQKVVPTNIFCDLVEGDLNRRFDHTKYGIRPKHRVISAHPTISDELPNRLLSGTVVVKPNIKHFRERDIVFEDDSVAENVDEVIYCTGYTFSFPLVEGGKLIPVVKNRHEGIYLNMFPLPTSDKNTLAFVGLVQPWGSVMPMSELQSRLFFAQLAGEAKLPSQKEMRDLIAEERRKLRERYYEADRHTLQVDFVSYLDTVARLIGCHPEEDWTLALKDPMLYLKVLFGPCVSYIYRIRGPHAWPGAREAVMGVGKRTDMGFKNARKVVIQEQGGGIKYFFFGVLFAVLFYLFFC